MDAMLLMGQLRGKIAYCHSELKFLYHSTLNRAYYVGEAEYMVKEIDVATGKILRRISHMEVQSLGNLSGLPVPVQNAFCGKK